MNQMVSSSQGRKWLTSLSPAVTSREATVGSVTELDAAKHLPQIPVAEAIEVSLPSRKNFHTEAIHHQFQGIGTPQVSNLSELEIPSMTTLKTNSDNHEIVFVSIPNLGEDAASACTLNNLADQTTPHDQCVSAVAETESEFEIADSVPVILGTTAAFAASRTDIGVETEEVESTQNIADPSPTPSPTPTPTKFAGGEIGILVEKIIDRFPLASPTVLLFVGGEANPNVEETCARVASALAACNVGNVLLVDGDLAHKNLTVAGGMSDQPGLAEAINRSQDWRSMVVSQDSASFSFLPAGMCPSDRWNSNELLRKVNAEIKREFQFVCVAAGDAHTKHAKLWCEVCDGSFLVVSLKNSNETFAKSAVQELTSNGARVLGCVVADAE